MTKMLLIKAIDKNQQNKVNRNNLTTKPNKARGSDFGLIHKLLTILCNTMLI